MAEKIGGISFDVKIKDHDLHQWFLIFLKSGNTFDYTKNLRNTKIKDPKNKQKAPA